MSVTVVRDRLFCGIDPGVSGAVAVIDTLKNVVLLEKLPVDKVPKSSGGYRSVLSFAAMASLFERLKSLNANLDVIVESVTPMLRDSRASAFAFGGSFWAIQQALACNRIGYTLVTAKTWQKELLPVCPKDRKQRLGTYRTFAQQMFPSADLSAASSTDKAAALLLALYCRSHNVK